MAFDYCGMWLMHLGACVIEEGTDCVPSPNYPLAYDVNSKCEFSMLPDRQRPVKGIAWNVGSGDSLTFNDQIFSSSGCVLFDSGNPAIPCDNGFIGTFDNILLGKHWSQTAGGNRIQNEVTGVVHK